MQYLAHKFISDIIDLRCRVKRISVSKAAIEIGISKSTLSRIERDGMPDILTYFKICDWLKTYADKYIRR
jgi:transcriptional regulator with XRE-family HTH domain